MIVLLSDTVSLNPALAATLRREVCRRKRSVAYISSSPQRYPRKWFEATVNEYARIDPNIEVAYFDLAEPYQSLSRIREFGTIHLSGGNTFEFLDSLRQRGFSRILKSHLLNGGLIVGVSAGGIVLTPVVTTAYIAGDAHDGDPQKIGLGFAQFEFLPHFYGSESEMEAIRKYSLKTPNDIYACDDQSGVVLHQGRVNLYGNVVALRRGTFLDGSEVALGKTAA